MPLTFEQYYALNPILAFSENRWNVWDPMIETRFRTETYWTPLIAFVDNNAAADKSQYTGNEAIPGHVNSNAIGNRDLWKEHPLYWDSKGKSLSANRRWGQFIQLHEYDKLLNLFQSGGISKDQFLIACAKGMLGKSVIDTFERESRFWLLRKALHKFYGPLGQYTSFADIKRSPSDAFNLSVMSDTRLRLGFRSADSLGRFGGWEQPVPNRPGALSVITSPGVVHDLWTQRNDWMVNLTTLQDQRLINGGKIEYQNSVIVEAPWNHSVLWNAGRVDVQLPVYKYLATDRQPIAGAVSGTSPLIDATRAGTGIREDDGAPIPMSDPVDGYIRTGQDDLTTCHFIVCGPMALPATDPDVIVPGDNVTIHTQRTAPGGISGYTFWGINYGVNWWDGETQQVEVQAVIQTGTPGTDPVLLQFRRPITYSYETTLVAGGAASTLANKANDVAGTPFTAIAGRDVVAWVTKAQHIHPVVINAARGAHVFAMNKKITFHSPPAIDTWESVYRQSWDCYGDFNVWDLDLYEVLFVAGSIGNRAMGIDF